MAAKLGTGNVLFRAGSGSPSKVFLGSTAVQTVPDAPVITSAVYVSGDLYTLVQCDLPSDTGGLPLIASQFYVNDVPATPDSVATPLAATFSSNLTGDEVRVAVSNAIGEGAKSAPVTVTAF